MPTPPAAVPLRNRYLAALLAWLVPGLGHFYQGRTGKGVLYAASILGLFYAGLAMGDWRVVTWRWISPLVDSEHFCYPYLGQFFAGLAALPALVQATLAHYKIDPILWSFMADPPNGELNGLYPRLGRLVEVGSLYTTVAGLLNILAIYDAFEGPAHVDDPAAATATPAPAPAPAPPQPAEVAR